MSTELVEGPRVPFPLPQVTLVGDPQQLYLDFERFLGDTTATSVPGEDGGQQPLSDKGTSAPLSIEGNGTYFPIPLTLSQPNDLFRRRLEMCVAFSYPTH